MNALEVASCEPVGLASSAAGQKAQQRSLVSGRLFSLLYERSLIYNQCWEDPALDRAALRLTPADRLIAITSAGCNVLDYALLGPQVLAVDANPRQNHLLELKLAAIAGLDYEAFFRLFGDGGLPGAADLYREALRERLGEPAREYWDRGISSFDPRRTRGGSFYYSGTSGFFAWVFRCYLQITGLRRGVDRVLAASTIEEQLRLYHDHVRRHLGDSLLSVVGSGRVLTLLGVPEPQRALVRSHAGGVVGYLRDCLDHVLSVSLLRENYFWAVYLTGRYDAAACPEYLRRESFARLQGGLAGNVRIATATLSSALARGDDRYTAFVLLDHMDWLVRRPHLLEEEWRLIFERAAPGARVIFRSGAADASVVPGWARRRLIFDEERARALHAQDRVGTYGSFHIARLA
jgi:S-adenosylmethionine-diacylglycerol 3-amino-3-carboxypropyl transferase